MSDARKFSYLVYKDWYASTILIGFQCNLQSKKNARGYFVLLLGQAWINSILSYFRLKRKVKKFSLIVASYDVVRNDIEFFR